MSYSGALEELKSITFTGLNSSYDAVNSPPMSADLPALVIDNAVQPFTEGFTNWNVAESTGQFIVFVDHLLLIDGSQAGTIESRWDDRVTYVDRYMTALLGNFRLDANLATPLKIVIVEQGDIRYRKQLYNGIRFRHWWDVRVTV